MPRTWMYFLTMYLCTMTNSSFAMDTTRQLLDPSQRAVPDGRHLYVHLNDGGLTARTNSLGLTSIAGGLIPGAIEGAVDDKRQKNASDLLTPITAALRDLDMEEKTVKASLEIASRLEWLDAQLDRDASAAAAGPSGTSGDSRQRVSLDYGIQMEPRFDAIQLSLLIQISAPKAKKSEMRFRQYFICFVPLRSPDLDPASNANRWADADAALVRNALDIGLSKLSDMAARGLQLTKSEVASTRSLKSYRVGYSKKAVENYYGRILEKDVTGTLIESKFGDWVYYYWPTRETVGAL